MKGEVSAGKIDFGTGQLHYRTGGSGMPLLVIPDLYDQGELIEDLAGCCQVFFPWLPGFGESVSLAGEHTNSKLAWALLTLAGALELKQFNVLSFGIGSGVASEIIRRRPTAVNKLVMVDPFAPVRLVDTLPGVMWIKHVFGNAPFNPRAAREWLLDTTRYDLRKTLGDRIDTALIVPERTDGLVNSVCEFIHG